jgi:hypothetical protein
VEVRITGLKDKTDIKEKNRRILRQKAQDLWKEYAKTLWFHQKTKPVNHGHWKRRGASHRYT